MKLCNSKNVRWCVSGALLLAVVFIVWLTLVWLKQRPATADGVAGWQAADISSGPRGAAVKLVVYLDFQCPFSKEYFTLLERALREYNNNLSIAWRIYPLINSERSWNDAKAFVCLRDQAQAAAAGLFALSDQSVATIDDYRALARSLNANDDDFQDCWQSAETLQRLQAQRSAALEAGVIGTPHTFGSEANYPGSLPWDDYQNKDGQVFLGLRSIIDKSLKNK